MASNSKDSPNIVDQSLTRRREAAPLYQTSVTNSEMSDFVLAVPADISSLIFFYACQPTPNPLQFNHSNPRWNCQCYPLLLGQVCQHWRRLAWKTSELWQTIIVRIRRSPAGINAQERLLRQWILRAKGRELDIYLEEFGNNPLLSTTDPVESLLMVLVRHAQQWRIIDFHLPQKRYLFLAYLGAKYGVRKVLPLRYSASTSRNTAGTSESHKPVEEHGLPLTLLRIASLHGARDEKILRGDIGPMNLMHATSLRELAVSSLIMKPGMLVSVPTKGITRLTLSCVLHLLLEEILNQLPQLAELTLSKCSVARKIDPNANVVPIIHKNLRGLYIEAETEFLFSMIVRQLCFPSLKKIHICIAEEFHHTNFLLSFIKRSECALTNLTTETICSTKRYDLIEFLSSEVVSSSLKNLRILDYDTTSKVKKRRKVIRRNMEQGVFFALDDQFFGNFHPYAFPHLLPQLETLEYRGTLHVDAINFLEPFILRSRMREYEPGSAVDQIVSQDITVLRNVRIQADRTSGKPFRISNYEDPQYVWEVFKIVDAGVLTLLDKDGVRWD